MMSGILNDTQKSELRQNRLTSVFYPFETLAAWSFFDPFLSLAATRCPERHGYISSIQCV